MQSNPYPNDPNYMPPREQQKKQARKYRVARVMDYLQWVLYALEILFLMRFVLKLLGADPTNQFAVTLYNFTGFFLAPFESIVPSTQLGTNGVTIIEWSTLVGMAVYALLFYLVKLLLRITVSRPHEPNWVIVLSHTEQFIIYILNTMLWWTKGLVKEVLAWRRSLVARTILFWRIIGALIFLGLGAIIDPIILLLIATAIAYVLFPLVKIFRRFMPHFPIFRCSCHVLKAFELMLDFISMLGASIM
jgi:hypothetical protein